MQCNNYTINNFNFLNLNVIKQLKKFGQVCHLAYLIIRARSYKHRTIALGVRVVEKHFTDENLEKVLTWI